MQLDSEIVGNKSGQISFDTNDTDENPFNYSVSGTVYREIPFGGKQKAQFTDQSGDLVTVSLSGEGTGLVRRITPEDVGSDATLIELWGTKDKSALTIKTKGLDNQTTIGEIIVNGSLKTITAKTTDLAGDLCVYGSLDKLLLDDIVGSSIITTADEAVKGFSFKGDDIADGVVFNLAGTVKSFQSNSFPGGQLSADDSIKKIKIKNGNFSADVEAHSGDILTISAVGDITGDITAGGMIKKIYTKSGSFTGAAQSGGDILTVSAMGDITGDITAGGMIKKIYTKSGDITGDITAAGMIKKIYTKSGVLTGSVTAGTEINSITAFCQISGKISADGRIKKIISKRGNFTGVARSGVEIGTVQAYNLTNALISAWTNIKKVSIRDNITDSYIVAGYDIGADCAFGQQQTDWDDKEGVGDIKSVTAKGRFAGSYICAGTLVYTSETSDALTNKLPYINSGSIGKVKFGSIEFEAAENFGLFAATEIKPFKAGGETFTSGDSRYQFHVAILP